MGVNNMLVEMILRKGIAIMATRFAGKSIVNTTLAACLLKDLARDMKNGVIKNSSDVTEAYAMKLVSKYTPAAAIGKNITTIATWLAAVIA